MICLFLISFVLWLLFAVGLYVVADRQMPEVVPRPERAELVKFVISAGFLGGTLTCIAQALNTSIFQ